MLRFGRVAAVVLIVLGAGAFAWAVRQPWGSEIAASTMPGIRRVGRVPDADSVPVLAAWAGTLTVLAALLIVALFRLKGVRAAVLRIRVLPVSYRLAVPAAVVATVAAVGGAVAFLDARSQLARIDSGPVVDLNSRPVLVYASVAVVAVAALTVGWVLLAVVLVAGRVRRVRRVRAGVAAVAVPAVATVLAVVAAVGAVVVGTYGTGVDATTAQPLPDRPPGVPGNLDRAAWTGTAESPVTVVGRYLVTAVADGIVVRDVVTGDERWHYRRRALYVPKRAYGQALLWATPPIGVSADRRTVVALWRSLDDTEIIAGFDLATGHLRWTRALPVDRSGPPPRFGVGRLFHSGDTMVVTRGPRLDGVDVRTGRTWRWQPPTGCRAEQFAQATDVVVAAVACDRDVDRIIGVSVADGGERWTWRTPSAGENSGALAVFGTTVRVLTREHGDVTLDAATGAPRHEPTPRRSSRGELRGPDTTVYLETSRTVPKATAVDSAGVVRWETAVPGLAQALVTQAVVDDGVGYALVEPPAGHGARTPWNQRLIAFDLATGAVLAARDILIPTECTCGYGGLTMIVDAGTLTLMYLTAGGVGVTVYA